MGRKAAPQPLALSDTSASRGRDDLSTSETALQSVSPAESKSPKSARSSPFHSRFSPLKSQGAKHQQKHQQQQSPQLQLRQDSSHHAQPNCQPTAEDAPSTYPSISSAFEQPPEPPSKEASAAKTKHEAKKSSKNNFFHFNKTPKSTNQYQPQVHQHHHTQNNYTESPREIMSRGGDGISSRARYGDPTQSDLSLQKPISADPSRSDLSVASSPDYETSSFQSSSRKAKSKPFGRIKRTRSIREGESASASANASPKESSVPTHPTGNEPELYLNSIPIRTAPAVQERSFRDMMGSAVRNRSEDRVPIRDLSATREGHRERESRTQPSSLRENGGSNFLSGLKSSSTRAADIFSKGLFGKSSRSSSTNEREPAIDDENYQLKVINLPLIEQTRLTRISKRLEDSRDKTEFWMPAFPWRAIDYLNYKGCEVEGLYRVPGSGPQIKKWQRRFDEQYDVNLFEEDDLYDINIIGSMLKAWLRELPDELFPKAAQERVARECAGAKQVPQLLIDELSNLSPFNYYLLFAITCHLSLLLAHSDKNKMDFRNLCICFQPCMKIDAFCFKFLVCDWRDCWKGCKHESRYIEEEYRLFDQPPPRGLAEPQKPARQDLDIERQQLSSSDSSKQSGLGHGDQPPPRGWAEAQKPARQDPDMERQQLSSSGSSKQSGLGLADQKLRPRRKPLQLSQSNGSMASNESTISTTVTTNGDREAGRGTADLRPLSPIQPLSPFGF